MTVLNGARHRLEDLHDVLSVEEAARFLGVGRHAYYDAIKRDQVPAVKVGRRYLVPKAMLKSYLENGKPTTDHIA